MEQFREYSELIAILKNQCSTSIVKVIKHTCLPKNIKEFLIYNIENSCHPREFLDYVEEQFLEYSKQRVYPARIFLSTLQRSFSLSASLLGIFSENPNVRLPLTSIDLAYTNQEGQMELYNDSHSNYSYLTPSFAGNKIILRIRNRERFSIDADKYNLLASNVPVYTSQEISSRVKIADLTYNNEPLPCRYFAISQDAQHIVVGGLYIPVIGMYSNGNVIYNSFIYENYPTAIITGVAISRGGTIIAVSTTEGAFLSKDFGLTWSLVGTGYFKCCAVSGDGIAILFGSGWGQNHSFAYLLLSVNSGVFFGKIQCNDQNGATETGEYNAVSIDDDSASAIIGCGNMIYVISLKNTGDVYGYGYNIGEITAVNLRPNGKTFAISGYNEDSNVVTYGIIDKDGARNGFVKTPYVAKDVGKVISITATGDYVIQNASLGQNGFIQSTNASTTYQYISTDFYNNTIINSKNNTQYIYGVNTALYYQALVPENSTQSISQIELYEVSEFEDQSIEIDGEVSSIANAQNLDQVVQLIDSRINRSFAYSHIEENGKKIFYELLAKRNEI